MATSRTAQPGAGKGPPPGSENNPHKRTESERIAEDLAAYRKAGGKVEKLGVTRVLQKIETPKPESVPKPRAGRPRKH